MKCSCNVPTYSDGGEFEVLEHKMVVLEPDTESRRCDECNRWLPYEKEYEYYKGSSSSYYEDEEDYIYEAITCPDCISLRDNFFTSWTCKILWTEFKDHMDDCGWAVPEECLAKCTPWTRAKICEYIEKYWKETEGENSNDKPT